MQRVIGVKHIKPSQHSVQARLPEQYRKYLKALKEPQAPVHYIPEPMKYKYDPLFKRRTHTETREIPLKFPQQADEGIWGGEGVIQGFTKLEVKRRRRPNFWVPNLSRTVVYSEILNQYMKVTVTQRTLKLIDENCGFDHYILGTPVQDLKSQLALSIRRKMLFALLNKEKYHKDEEKNKEVFSKYEKYMIPREEAEWFGLTMREAVQKQRLIEFEEKEPVPLKLQLRMQFIDDLKNNKLDGGEEGESNDYVSWFKKLNPFGKKTESKED